MLITYFYFLAEGSIGSVLQLTLMVDIVDHPGSNDIGCQALLLRDIIKTESPASAEMLIKIRTISFVFQSTEMSIPLVYSLSFKETLLLPGRRLSGKHRQ